MMIIDPYRFGNPNELLCSTASFGNAALGNATIVVNTAFTADRHYNNLTLQARITLNGWKLYVDGILNIDHADALIRPGDPSLASNPPVLLGDSGSQGGLAPVPGEINSTGNGGIGGAGGTGSLLGTAKSDGEPGYPGTMEGEESPSVPVDAGNYLGGRGGAGGAGGNSNQTPPNTGGIGGTSPEPTGDPAGSLTLYDDLWYGGSPGGGGGGGADPGGFAFGGHGASGGCGGGLLWIAARTINRGASTVAGCIQAPGYDGADGGGGSATGGLNGGGGGGSGGGGGGAIFLLFGALTGSTATDCLSTAGGAGGDGQNALGAGATAGAGGAGGDGGRIFVRNCANNTFTITTGSAGNAASGQTGGAGGSCSVSL
jgi:hypothetical protein